jgi:hypothetical protein
MLSFMFALMISPAAGMFSLLGYGNDENSLSTEDGNEYTVDSPTGNDEDATLSVSPSVLDLVVPQFGTEDEKEPGVDDAFLQTTNALDDDPDEEQILLDADEEGGKCNCNSTTCASCIRTVWNNYLRRLCVCMCGCMGRCCPDCAPATGQAADTIGLARIDTDDEETMVNVFESAKGCEKHCMCCWNSISNCLKGMWKCCCSDLCEAKVTRKEYEKQVSITNELIKGMEIALQTGSRYRDLIKELGGQLELRALDREIQEHLQEEKRRRIGNKRLQDALGDGGLGLPL